MIIAYERHGGDRMRFSRIIWQDEYGNEVRRRGRTGQTGESAPKRGLRLASGLEWRLQIK